MRVTDCNHNELGELLLGEIRREGVVSFARFMEIALYCPELGYYEQKLNTPGRRGDFFTGVSVGPLLGRLLGFQIGRWAAEMPDRAFVVVEAGAHDGQLASDILAWVDACRPDLAERLQYRILEPSVRRQAWQRELLGARAGQVQWFSDWASVGPSGLSGVVLGNELLDAFPVHCLGWDAARREWTEWGVALDGLAGLVWRPMPRSARLGSADVPTVSEELAAVLPDGFRVEVSPEAEAWWRRAGGALRTGRLLALDYGLESEERLMPGRAAGTLRAYAGHRMVEVVLDRPGEQDLTAHVDWGRIRRAGEAVGLVTETFLAQGRFLSGVAAEAMRSGAGFGSWTEAETRQFQVLSHPAHMGMQFQVLVQRKGASDQAVAVPRTAGYASTG